MKPQACRIALLYRSPRHEARDEFTEFVPSGLFNILQALLDNGFDARLYNLSAFTASDLRQFVRSLSCHVAGISAFSGNHIESLKLARLLKNERPGMRIVMGGPFAVLADAILRREQAVDFVVRGEGELALVALARLVSGGGTVADVPGLWYRRNGGIAHNPSGYHPSIDDFFYLPSRLTSFCHGVRPENFSVLISSRGCPDRCSFCSSPVLWKNRIRYHDTARLIAYLRDIRQAFGSIYFSMRDDNFLMHKSRALDFAEALCRENLHYLWNTQGSARFVNGELARTLALAGCDQVQMGIEAASPELLSFLNKKLSPAQATNATGILRGELIRPFGYFIGGMGETAAQADETVRFIRRSGIMDGVVSPLVVYPGTAIAAAASEELFFGPGEILYYDRPSYEKYRDRYLRALAEAHERRGFTAGELGRKRPHSAVASVAKHFDFLSREDVPAARAALDELMDREPQNPWPFLLTADLWRKTGDKAAAATHYRRANALTGGRNGEIAECLSTLER